MGQSAGGLIVGLERAQAIPVMLQDEKQDQGVGGVIFGAGRAEGAALAAAGGWVDGIDRNPGPLQQSSDYRTFKRRNASSVANLASARQLGVCGPEGL